jgi:enamine deaminase RidA (YjgF/YER057c/UK114 family)
VAFSHYNHITAQLPVDPASGEMVAGGVREQAQQCLANIRAIVESVDHVMDDIVKVNLYLADIADLDAVDEVYATFFPGYVPARRVVGVSPCPVARRSRSMPPCRTPRAPRPERDTCVTLPGADPPRIGPRVCFSGEVAGQCTTPWARSTDDVLAAFGSASGGLTPDEAAARLERYGPNEIAAAGVSRPGGSCSTSSGTS